MLINFSRAGWMPSRCLTLLFGSAFCTTFAVDRRNAQLGTRNWHVPGMLQLRTVQPQHCTTAEIDFGNFGTPKTTVWWMSGTLHPIPAASIAQITRNCPDLKLSQIAVFPHTDIVDEYENTSPRR